MKIAIMGMGNFGTALGGVLADNGYDIDYYDPKVEKERLADVVKNAKMIVVAVPSEVITRLLAHLPKDVPLVIATKGILNERIFDEFKDWMVLSGPGFADDIKHHEDIKWTVTDERLKEVFAAKYITIDLTRDKQGILLCGALKNAYAMLAGYLDLEPETELWWRYLKDVAHEMRAILNANGASGATFDHACGWADLRITCTPQSRNYTYGQKVRRKPGYVSKKTVEGLEVLNRIRHKEIIVPEAAGFLQMLLERSETWR